LGIEDFQNCSDDDLTMNKAARLLHLCFGPWLFLSSAKAQTPAEVPTLAKRGMQTKNDHGVRVYSQADNTNARNAAIGRRLLQR